MSIAVSNDISFVKTLAQHCTEKPRVAVEILRDVFSWPLLLGFPVGSTFQRAAVLFKTIEGGFNCERSLRGAHRIIKQDAIKSREVSDVVGSSFFTFQWLNAGKIIIVAVNTFNLITIVGGTSFIYSFGSRLKQDIQTLRQMQKEGNQDLSRIKLKLIRDITYIAIGVLSISVAIMNIGATTVTKSLLLTMALLAKIAFFHEEKRALNIL